MKTFKRKFRGKPILAIESFRNAFPYFEDGFIFGNIGNDENGEPWILGNIEYCESDGLDWAVRIIPETVGQYIGVSDMSEKQQELYEDDVVEITIFNPFQPEKIIVQKHRKIEFENGVFGVRWNHILMPFCQFAPNCTIIKAGNIHDNPELVNADE